MNDISNIVVYNDGELELKVSLNEETIWLTQKQMADVFGVNIPAISKHIKNIYKDKELNQFSTVSIFEIVQKEGNREVIRNVEHYNLDIENDVNILKSQMSEVKLLVKNNKLEINQGIFYDGQVYDSYGFILDLIKQAKSQISKIPNIKITIYTNNISKQLKLDFEKYSKQYDNITLKIFQNSHDRFLIFDKKEIFHIGASLKDLGKKWFVFSKINLDINELIKKLD